MIDSYSSAIIDKSSNGFLVPVNDSWNKFGIE